MNIANAILMIIGLLGVPHGSSAAHAAQNKSENLVEPVTITPSIFERVR